MFDFSTMKKPGRVTSQIEDGVGIIKLADPPNNPAGGGPAEAILALFDQFEQDDRVRCIMLTHEGPHFSAEGASAEGAEFYKHRGPDDTIADLMRYFRHSGKALVDRIENCPKPTLSAGTGKLAGAASVMFNCCDIRIAGESLCINDGNLYSGSISDWGFGGTRMPIWIGRNKTMDYMFLDENFTARQMYEMGLVSKVVPDAQVYSIGLGYAKRIAQTAPLSVKYFKEELRRAIYGSESLEEKVEKEIEVAEYICTTEDAQRCAELLTSNREVGVYPKMGDLKDDDGGFFFKGK